MVWNGYRWKVLLWEFSKIIEPFWCVIRLATPDFNLFDNFKKFRSSHPQSNFHIIDPRSIWRAWTALQDLTDVPIRKNPPTSGFIGKLVDVKLEALGLGVIMYDRSTSRAGSSIACLPLHRRGGIHTKHSHERAVSLL